MESKERRIEIYVTQDGKCPYVNWLNSLKDIKARTKIRLRLDRVEKGNMGDVKSVGKGIRELRINYGPGYRVYFGQVGASVVLLLGGGDKTTQEQDIIKTQEYWGDYTSREDD